MLGIESLRVEEPLLFGDQIETAYANIITDRYLLDMDDARPVFLTIQKWIEKANLIIRPRPKQQNTRKLFRIMHWPISIWYFSRAMDRIKPKCINDVSIYLSNC